ncbi:hypothetical protein FB446DRAFT_739594 [Lentinula raphanica]|nr:hypothetical protein FB446DRAFT_739594 [Lentinula raphanica]
MRSLLVSKMPALTREQVLRIDVRDAKRKLKRKEQELESVRKAARDRNTCKVCLQIFNDPYMLTCGHAFCEPCLKGVYQFVPVCPTCYVQPECFPFVSLHLEQDLADMLADEQSIRNRDPANSIGPFSLSN